VGAGSDADRAGLHVGDAVLAVNCGAASSDLDGQIAGLPPGSTVKLKVSAHDKVREVKIKLAARDEMRFSLVDRSDVSVDEKARRAAWIRGDSQEDH